MDNLQDYKRVFDEYHRKVYARLIDELASKRDDKRITGRRFDIEIARLDKWIMRMDEYCVKAHIGFYLNEAKRGSCSPLASRLGIDCP